MAVPVKVARQQTTPKPSETLKLSASTNRNPPEPSEPASGTYTRTFRKLPPELTPPHTGTFQNLPEPASGTYTSTHRNPPESSGTCLRNLHQHTPEPCGNYTSTPEPSGTCLRNLHQHTPELSGTFRNLPPEPAPATRTGTHRSLSGLKTPLAYAVGEKIIQHRAFWLIFLLFHFLANFRLLFLIWKSQLVCQLWWFSHRRLISFPRSIKNHLFSSKFWYPISCLILIENCL